MVVDQPTGQTRHGMQKPYSVAPDLGAPTDTNLLCAFARRAVCAHRAPTWCRCCRLPATCTPGLSCAGCCIRLSPSFSSSGSPAASPVAAGCCGTSSSSCCRPAAACTPAGCCNRATSTAIPTSSSVSIVVTEDSFSLGLSCAAPAWARCLQARRANAARQFSTGNKTDSNCKSG